MPSSDNDPIAYWQDNTGTAGFSDGVAGNSMSPFFGFMPGVDPKQLPDRDRQWAFSNLSANMSLPSEFLGDTIEGLVAIDNDWPTTVALPMTWTNALKFGWKTMHFDQSLVPFVQENGVPRAVTHGQEEHSASMMRHAIAMILDREFMTTPQGLRDYAYQLQQIRRDIQRTNYFEVIFALMNTGLDEATWRALYGSKPSTESVENRMADEVFSFGLLTKDSSGKAPEIMHSRLQVHATKAGFTIDVSQYASPDC